MKVAVGCDEAAFALKETLKTEIALIGNEDRGVLLCGTGIGMSIAANKVPGIRAALCHDTYSAERAVKSNNAQILTMGARVVGSEVAKSVLRTFLKSVFKDGPSTPKIEKIMEYEREFHRHEKRE